jgi:hypothetical protein
MSDISKIETQMAVVAADGRAIGFVSRVGADTLTLTNVKEGRGFDHVLPLSWIAEVGKYVFLNKGSRYVAANWDAPNGVAGSRPQLRAA